MNAVKIINFTIMCLFFLCYSYQFFYVLVSLLGRQRPHGIERRHRYIESFFKDTQWQPIRHERRMTLEQICAGDRKALPPTGRR